MPAAAYSSSTRSFFIVLGAALLVSTAAFVVMRLYMRTVFVKVSGAHRLRNLTQKRKTSFAPAAVGDRTPRDPDRAAREDCQRASVPSPNFQHAESAFRRAACVYALGGCVHAATCVCLLFVLGFIPSRLRARH